MAEEDQVPIDEGLYSRQLYVLGHDAMRRMALANVLISGMGGLGIEIAKNVVLAGVKAVTVHDPSQEVDPYERSSQFFLRDQPSGSRSFLESTAAELSELNSYVKVDSYNGQLTDEFISKFKVVVLTRSESDEQLLLGDKCHDRGIHFILAETKGVFGRIFCDFGENFTVIDTNGEAPYQYHINKIIKGEKTEVILTDDVRHMFDVGDEVVFSEVQGMTEINKWSPVEITATGTYSITVGDTSSFGNYKNGGLVTHVKKPNQMNFKRLRESVDEPSFELRIFNEARVKQLHLAFSALHEFIRRNRTLPKPWNQADADQFLELATSRNKTLKSPLDKLDEALLRNFSYTASGNLSPIQAIIGGIAAQEIMKALSGKFTPIHQWLYYDAIDCLPSDDISRLQDICQPIGSRYDGQIAVFGKELQEKLSKVQLFLVGAGAIGCEMLKNWAMMGVATDPKGKVTVTDMDTIEKSNLNRQFLFRPADVEKPKSMTAAESVKRMNPAIHIEAHENRIGPETENIYNDDFFEGLTAVVNALDNVEARKYVDQRCVFNLKPMFDSGTLGARCSLQVVIPRTTQCYSDTRDPPDRSYPMCTLKHFPVAIEHTLQWARDEFEGLFKQSIETSAKYYAEEDFIETTRKLDGFKPMEILQQLKTVLVDMAPKTFSDCVVWARKKFQDNYTNQILQLLHVFPSDHVTKTGAPFWSGPKRCPDPLKFSVENTTHLDYVVAAANLVAQTFGLPGNRNREEVAQLAASITIDEFQPTSKVHIPTNDEEAKEAADKALDAESVEEMERIVAALPDKNTKLTLHPLHFEKDDDSNFHMDFIVAASNLRAENYGIMPADRHKSKLIAGKIIPAIATTTSVVVGLVCIELYKWIQGIRKIESFKNGFINIATNSFVFTRPSAAAKKKYTAEFTIWDRFDIKGEITLQELIDHFKTEHQLTVEMISYGPSILYSVGITANPTERLAMPVSKAAEQVSKKPIPAHAKSIRLEIGCYNDKDEEIGLPFVKYNLVR